jgi:hypothetical protein
MDGDETEPNRNIIIVPGPNRELLTDKEHIDYYEYRKSFLTWLLRFGKDPQRAKGYSPYSVYSMWTSLDTALRPVEVGRTKVTVGWTPRT